MVDIKDVHLDDLYYHYDGVPTRKTNRHTKKKASSSKPSWCPKCDRDAIRDGEKCPTCGYQDKVKKMKHQDEPVYNDVK